VTRIALAAPDEPDGPNREAVFMHFYAVAMTAAITRHRCSSKPVNRTRIKDVDFEGVDFVHVDDSGKVVLVQAKRWSPPAKRPWYARISPQRLAGVAVFIAGRKRAALGTEWCAHLSGETGAGLPQGRQLQAAAGFILAAVRYRLQDAADLAWRPVDVVLGSRELSNLVVLLATFGMSVVFLRSRGFYNLCVNFQNVAAVWAAAYGLIRVGRWWRGVKPPKHEPRRKRE
jgi:hypothetical protein